MAAPTDFLRLYQELGLAPGASVEDLRQAYRRRVAELHPDRMGKTFSATVPGAADRLQQLTALYGAATQFHRQHGRLPGASAPPRPQGGSGQTSNTTPAAAPKATSRIIWLLIALAVLLGWFLWPPQPADNGADSDDTSDDAATHADPSPPPPMRAAVQAEPVVPVHVPALKLGMHDDEVVAIEGQPVSRSGGHWDYGPSWIEFDVDRNKVTGWYSSPLRPLRNASMHPPPKTAKAEIEP